MSKSLNVNGEAWGRAVGQGQTRYVGITGPMPIFQSTEGATETPVREAGVFNNLYIYVASNSANISSVITLRKSRADTSVTVTYTSGQTGVKQDTSNTATYANTDEADYSIVLAAGSGDINFRVLGIEFAPTDTTKTIQWAGWTGTGLSTASTTVYKSIGGSNTTTATEADAKYRIRGTFTASNFYATVSSNGRTTDTTVGMRKNGAAGNMSVIYTSGQTGAKEDTSNTDSLVAGDDYNLYYTTSTGGGTWQSSREYVQFSSTANQFIFSVARPAQAFGAANTWYFPLCGDLSVPGNQEANAQIYPEFEFTAKELETYVSANSASFTSTFTIRDGGADSSVTISYTTGQTGLKTDSTNTATIGVDQNISTKLATPAGSGSITIGWVGSMGETAGVAGAVTPARTMRLFEGFSIKLISGRVILHQKQ